ncbi:MAG: hypothetical protein K2X82_06050 [Gemmataceae bacterium]|nr:hypothetical protein [Gemmataceae bacterium]
MDSVLPERHRFHLTARLVRGVGLVAVAGLACAAAFYLGSLASDAVTPKPVAGPPAVVVNGLAVDAADLALGEVWETPHFVARIRVRNVAAEPRTVTGWERSCVCVGVEPASLTLAPGEAAALTVSADLTRRDPHHRGLARRDATLRVRPVFAGDFAPADGWVLTAAVRSHISLEAPELVFGDDLAAGGPPKSRKLKVAAHGPLARVEAEPDSPAVSARVEPAGPDRYAVVVTPSPALPAGPFRCTVAVRAVTPDGVAHPAAPFDVSGAVGSPVRVFPRTVLVGEVAVPGAVTAEVTVILPAGGWAVERVEADAAGVDVQPVGPGPTGGTQYRITRPLTRPGVGQLEARFVVRGPDGQGETVPVEVRWFGRAADGKEGRP